MANKKTRENERAFYAKTKQNQNAPQQTISEASVKKQRTGPTPTWQYWLPTFLAPTLVFIAIVILGQYVMMTFHNISLGNKVDVGLFHNFGITPVYLIALVLMPLLGYWVYKKTHATWFNNNAMYLSEDIQEYTNDAYIRTIDHLTQELDVAPDVGLGFDGHASTLMGHMMVDNKGINKIEMPQYDDTVDGYVKRDEDGNIVRKLVPMFNPELADMLFGMSGVPSESRILYDATQYDFNRRLTKKEGGGKDAKGNEKRAGAYGRKAYDKLSDYINNEFYPLDTDTERPAGIYFYDARPVNTILIAITRGGKGNELQTA